MSAQAKRYLTTAVVAVVAVSIANHVAQRNSTVARLIGR